jgi:hypothetical protein
MVGRTNDAFCIGRTNDAFCIGRTNVADGQLLWSDKPWVGQTSVGQTSVGQTSVAKKSRHRPNKTVFGLLFRFLRGEKKIDSFKNNILTVETPRLTLDSLWLS